MIQITENDIKKNWKKEYDNRPLVSIKNLVYNHEKYIAQALDGFLMQKTDFPFEVIVHDDASTDNSAQIIREYEKKFPSIIKPIYETENQYSKHDGSLGRIVNSKLSGKYVALCEGDDYWIDENKLQMQVDFLESHPDYMMCFHAAEVLDELQIGLKYEVLDKDYNPTELYENWIVPTASIVCKKEIISYPIKNPELFWAGDIVLIEKAAHLGKVKGFSSVMSVYRITQNGVTWKKNDVIKKAIKYIKHNLNIKRNFPKIKKSIINKKVSAYYLTLVLHEGSFFRKFYYLMSAFKYGGFYIFKNSFDRYKKRQSK